MNYILSAFFGYFLGSIPTAYILLKKVKGIDIRYQGSGNVGTLNSYEVTNSKKIGIIVLLIDLTKGILSVLIIKLFFGNQFLLPAISLVFAVLGHCFSIWLKFKGGRGLATAAGGSIVLAPIILFLWVLFWVITYMFKKNIHLSNILATFLVLLSALFNHKLLNSFAFPSAEKSIIFGFSISLVMVIILIKHREPFLEYIKNYKVNGINKK